MSGFAAELSGARDWMKVATAGEGGIRLYTCLTKVTKSMSKTTSKTCQEHNQKARGFKYWYDH